MSDDRPTGESEPPTDPVSRVPAEPSTPDAQPTTPLPPFGEQPTEAYDRGTLPGGAPAPAPTAPGSPAPQGETGPWPVAQWNTASYATGGATTAPSRRGLAVTALVLGIAAVVFALLGFIPLVGWPFIGLAGVLAVVALVLGIITVSAKNRDGRGMGLAGLILGPLSVLLTIAAIVFQVVFAFGLASHVIRSEDSGSDVFPGPSATAEATPEGDATPSDSASPTPSASPTGNYDEQAYLAEVKPQLLELWQTIRPGATTLPWSDDFLLLAGQQIESASSVADRADMRTAFVQSAVSQSKGVLTEEQAGKIFDLVADAADAHLVR